MKLPLEGVKSEEAAETAETVELEKSESYKTELEAAETAETVKLEKSEAMEVQPFSPMYDWTPRTRTA